MHDDPPLPDQQAIIRAFARPDQKEDEGPGQGKRCISEGRDADLGDHLLAATVG